MKIKFWLFAALFAAAGMTTACKDDEPNPNNGGGGVVPPQPGDFVKINKWMDEVMSEMYLWNEEYKTLTPDYQLNYKDFLSTALQGVSQQNNANAEDGYWKDGEWRYYSYIEQTPANIGKLTRDGERTQRYGFGITGHNIGNINGKIYICLLGVYPGSPADKAGMTRGSYISKVDGTEVSKDNAVELAQKLYPKTTTPVRFTVNTAKPNNITGAIQVQMVGSVTCQPTYYDANPVLVFGLVPWDPQDLSNKKVIAFMVYHEFDMSYDDTLIASFKEFHNAAAKSGYEITDLVLDLRYNGGGYLFSSALMASLIAGQEYAGQLYCRTTFNKDRNATTDPGDYFIGKKEVPEGIYPLLEEALPHALNLKRVYVITMSGTASASELIINGLRGLDLEVRTIGETSNGKNVGMEISTNSDQGFNYTFAPVTLRLENAKGFHDYSEGFEPDVLVTNPDIDWLIGDYGSNTDPLFTLAWEWITKGEKPSVKSNIGTRAADGVNYHSIGMPHYEQPNMPGAISRPLSK